MAKLTVWIAALGGIAIGAWTASAANAQSLSLSSPDIKEGGSVSVTGIAQPANVIIATSIEILK